LRPTSPPHTLHEVAHIASRLEAEQIELEQRAQDGCCCGSFAKMSYGGKGMCKKNVNPKVWDTPRSRNA